MPCSHMLLHKTSQCKENLAKHIDKLTWQCYSVLDKKTWHQERIPVMEKDQILEKSRKENKNQDIYEKEISEPPQLEFWPPYFLSYRF